MGKWCVRHPNASAAEGRIGLDIGKIGDQDFGQKKGSTPIPMEKSKSNTREGISSALSKKSQSTIDAKNYTKITSLHKPMSWAKHLKKLRTK